MNKNSNKRKHFHSDIVMCFDEYFVITISKIGSLLSLHIHVDSNLEMSAVEGEIEFKLE